MFDYLNASLLKDIKMKKFTNMVYTIVDDYLLNIKYATEKYDLQKLYNELQKCIE
jgi:hypothetical protein